MGIGKLDVVDSAEQTVRGGLLLVAILVMSLRVFCSGCFQDGIPVGRREELVVLPSPAELLLLGGGETTGADLLSPAELLLEKGQNDLDECLQLAEPEL